MNTDQLVELHRRMSPVLSRKPRNELLLWYADLDLNAGERNVQYRCPTCGRNLTMPLEEFLEHDSSTDLRCGECRGDLEERGGAMS